MSFIKVSSFGAYLTSWIIEGREVLYQGTELKRTGIPFLFPNFDAGAPLPSHGFGRVSNWQLIKNSPDCVQLRLTENDITPEYRQIYPYKFIADLKITTKNNQLDYLLEVKNLSLKKLPISPGLHPYWPVKHEEKSKIKLTNFPQFNPASVNWDTNPPNSLYDFKDELTANFPEYQLIIKDLSYNFSHLQIWSQNTTFPDFNYVCFEPVTRPPNGINTDPILINPNSKAKFHLQFQIIFP
ncbi:MAG: hypothetical protein WC784_02340 [Candidatus Shapirobacteria bacterium]|jgi:galactose mutarotase-like enzyme